MQEPQVYTGSDIRSCPNCGLQVELLGLPIEPLFDLDVAVVLIPMRKSALKTFLSRHKANFLPRYRLEGRVHRRVRLLSTSEIHKIREMVLRRPENMILPPMPGDLGCILVPASPRDTTQPTPGRAFV
jgi:hypothetical protein